MIALQRELLWDGWKGLLEGRYGAAQHQVRLLTDLTDIVRAVAISEDDADRLLSGEQLRVGDARETVLNSGRSVYFGPLVNADFNRVLQRFGHATNEMVSMALRPYPDRIDIHVAPSVHSAMLEMVSSQYVDLAIVSVSAVFVAVNEAFGSVISEGGVMMNRALALTQTAIALPAAAEDISGGEAGAGAR